MATNIVCSYLNNIVCVESLTRLTDQICQWLEGHKDEFDSIAFRGLSGGIVAPIIAVRMKKKILAVRKPTENAHSCNKFEGDASAQRYIIIDDFVSTGETIKKIVESIECGYREHAGFGIEMPPKCVGLCLYNQELYSATEGENRDKGFYDGKMSDMCYWTSVSRTIGLDPFVVGK